MCIVCCLSATLPSRRLWVKLSCCSGCKKLLVARAVFWLAVLVKSLKRVVTVKVGSHDQVGTQRIMILPLLFSQSAVPECSFCDHHRLCIIMAADPGSREPLKVLKPLSRTSQNERCGPGGLCSESCDEDDESCDEDNTEHSSDDDYDPTGVVSKPVSASRAAPARTLSTEERVRVAQGRLGELRRDSAMRHAHTEMGEQRSQRASSGLWMPIAGTKATSHVAQEISGEFGGRPQDLARDKRTTNPIGSCKRGRCKTTRVGCRFNHAS